MDTSCKPSRQSQVDTRFAELEKAQAETVQIVDDLELRLESVLRSREPEKTLASPKDDDLCAMAARIRVRTHITEDLSEKLKSIMSRLEL